jgi:BirA family transcriptional regulator, biotin operon repressor / biotin---[acetyl-CoA-carboxylase] ligase
MIYSTQSNESTLVPFYDAFKSVREDFPNNWRLYVFDEVSSTMDVAKAIFVDNSRNDIAPAKSIFGETVSNNNTPAIVLGLSQLAGRGREGKTWYSEKGNGIYVTYALPNPIRRANELSGFSLAASIAILRYVNELKGTVKLKWPNDVLYYDKQKLQYQKLCGILVELLSSGENVSLLTVGIGLNLKPSRSLHELNAISLEEVVGKKLNLIDIFVTLSNKFINVFNEYEKTGFSGFIDEWKSNSMMIGKNIKLDLGDSTEYFFVEGISNDGGLIIYSKSKGSRVIYSGTVEVIDVNSN